MLLYTCQACRMGKHGMCSGEQKPPPGMLGGSKCDCDGKCADRVGKDWKCPYCDEDGFNRETLASHLREKHEPTEKEMEELDDSEVAGPLEGGPFSDEMMKMLENFNG